MSLKFGTSPIVVECFGPNLQTGWFKQTPEVVDMLPIERRALQFLLKHLAAGAAGGFLFGALVLWYDVAGLATMIEVSSHRVLALFMLFFGFFITFGSLGMAVGVMGLGEERDSDPLPRPWRDD